MADDEGFETVSKKGRKTSINRGGFSSPAELFVNACEMSIFTVPDGLGSLTRENRDTILNRLRAMPADQRVLPSAANRRIMSLLDAFASLLVSQREKEIVSVAVSKVSEQHYIFWVSASSPENRLQDAKAHMEELWKLLRDLRTKVPVIIRKRGKTPDETEVTVDEQWDIYHSCYTFSRERLKKHFDKARERGMCIALQNLRDDAATYKLSDRRLAFVQSLIDLFRLYELYEQGDPNPEVQRKNAYTMIRQCEYVNIAKSKLEGKSVKWLDTLLPQCYDYAKSDGTTFERKLDKMLSLDSAIEHLLLLPESGSMGHVLDSTTIQVRTVNPSFAILHYDFAEDKLIQDAMSEDLPMPYDDFIFKLQDLRTPSGHPVIRKEHVTFPVHAECALLAHIDSLSTRTFNYFGVSKLCCVGCWLYFEAYRKIEAKSTPPRYYVRGTHSRQYPWVAPPFHSHREATLRTMEPIARDFFCGLIPKDVRTRSFSESGSASLIDHQVKKNWPDYDERSKKLPPIPPPGK
ncbi:hypothetical protein ACEPAI_4078 [Sanghuangporus weigelae]